jgi:hypothetical protein
MAPDHLHLIDDGSTTARLQSLVQVCGETKVGCYDVVIPGASIALERALAIAVLSGSSRGRILANFYSPPGDASCLWWARDEPTKNWQRH